jgi:hypothetical protein
MEAMSDDNATRAFEAKSLELVRDIQTELVTGLNALGRKSHRGLEDQFPFYSASHINRAVEGYLLLRQQFRFDASRLLIRPAIEAAIKILAVRNQPDLLYRIAYSEHLEDRKLVARAADAAAYFAQLEEKWCEFVKAYSDHFPKHELVDKRLPLRCAAIAARIEAYYDSAYRLYSQFAHAAFRATTGNLDDLHTHDNRTMALCALTGLDAVTSLNESALDVEPFRTRLSELHVNVEE